MAYYIKDYSLGSRQAVVKREESSCAERNHVYLYRQNCLFQ